MGKEGSDKYAINEPLIDKHEHHHHHHHSHDNEKSLSLINEKKVE